MIDLEQEDGLPDDTLVNWASDKVHLHCVVCRKEFSRIYRRNSRSITCSKECSKKHHSDYRKNARKTPEYKAKMAVYRARWQESHPDYVPPPQALRKTITLTHYNELLDEIERLRAALRKICEPITVAADPDSVSACQDLHELICATARAALGEVKDD